MLHEDARDLADPEKAGRWTKVKHKIGKTAWSVWDHKLPDKKTVAVMVAGAALSAGLAVVTGGASLAVQFAVAFAIGVGSGGIQKAVDHRNYRNRKAKIERAVAEETEQTRGTARNMHENLAYNEDHYLSTLAHFVEASKKLQGYEGKKELANEREMQEFVETVAVFWDRYSRAAHYYQQYEQYVFYTHRFAAHAKARHDAILPTVEDVIEKVVAQPRAWHKANCRTSRLSTDVCYGLRDGMLEIPGYTGGQPHHRLS